MRYWLRRWQSPRSGRLGLRSGVNVDERGKARFTTVSGQAVNRLYTPADLSEGWDAASDTGEPGKPPYTRGIHRDRYRGKLWTMRQFSGFATPGGNQPPLPIPARAGRRRPFRGLRPADADGLRRRSTR